MTKHYHQSKEEQIYNKAHGAEPFHFEKSTSSPSKVPVTDTSIQIRAYQIFNERGGSAMDNWLEAERTLREAV